MATAPDPITAQAVYEAAAAQHQHVGAEELGAAYQAMLDPTRRDAGGVFYTPKQVAEPMTRFALTKAVAQVGPGPEQLLRVVVVDPACGAGVFLVVAARLLAGEYAARLARTRPGPTLVQAVMPTVILACIYGIDIDPVAVELARLSLSLATGRLLPEYALAEHVSCGNALDGSDGPPAMERRTNRRLIDLSDVGGGCPWLNR
jgi:hypothetical protein